MRAEQPGGERLGGAPQLRPRQPDRPGGGLDGHLPVAVAAARPDSLAGLGPLIAVPAGELGDLGLQRGLHQQLRAEPGHVLQNLRQRPAPGEQLIDMVADTVGPVDRVNVQVPHDDGPVIVHAVPGVDGGQQHVP